ncbi:hypothetical protein B23_2166 [Geobacillus thermoleovorans B23]|nr:hypothetical protein B23_2166 [Geobacillus thermoleovorans B23]
MLEGTQSSVLPFDPNASLSENGYDLRPSHL